MLNSRLYEKEKSALDNRITEEYWPCNLPTSKLTAKLLQLFPLTAILCTLTLNLSLFTDEEPAEKRTGCFLIRNQIICTSMITGYIHSPHYFS